MSWSTSNSSYGGYYNRPIVNSISSSSYNSGSSLYGSYPKGLENLGNTCYISSVLQILFQIITEKDLPIRSKSQQEITFLFFELKKSKSRTDYKMFKEALEERVEIVKGWEQQDAHELLIHLLEELRMENSLPLVAGQADLSFNEKLSYGQNWLNFTSQMKKLQNSNIISLFYGDILKQFTCPYKHRKHNFQRFMDLSLAFTPRSSSSSFSYQGVLILRDMLDDFLGSQIIDDLFCEQCKRKTKFQKKSIFFSTPKYLVIHLARFVKGWYSNEKNNREVSYNDYLDLYEKNGEVKVKFRLIGIIHHIGSLNRGHYYSNIKVGGEWFLMNDDKVSRQQIKSSGNVSETVYFLIYEKE